MLGESADQVAAAQRELARIGIDKFSGAATGQPRELAADPSRLGTMMSVTFGELAKALAGPADGLPPADVVLDVRTNNEWRASHVEGAVHIPLYDLANRLGEVPAGTVWVHCGSGYRATAAAALLEGAGREPVLVDDHFAGAAQAGVKLVPDD